MTMQPKSFAQVFSVILERQASANHATSYVASLFHKGLDAILKKVGEEAAEVIISAKNPDRSAHIHEVTDLWFHLLLLMAALGLNLQDIEQEFGQRFGNSGLEEKAGRSRT